MDIWQRWVLAVFVVVATLTSVWLLYGLGRKRSRRRLSRGVERQLAEHLGNIGVRAEPGKTTEAVMRLREGKNRVYLRQLAQVQVWLNEIRLIEVWRKTEIAEGEPAVEDEITYVAPLEPGLTLSRIPILTSTLRLQTGSGETAFRWRGFEWGRLPLVADRLQADPDLNRRLLRHFNSDLPGELRIRAIPPDSIGISVTYGPQWLPSGELLACIEDIARHVKEYVAQRNRERAAEEESHRWSSPADARTARRRRA